MDSPLAVTSYRLVRASSSNPCHVQLDGHSSSTTFVIVTLRFAMSVDKTPQGDVDVDMIWVLDSLDQ